MTDLQMAAGYVRSLDVLACVLGQEDPSSLLRTSALPLHFEEKKAWMPADQNPAVAVPRERVVDVADAST